MAAGLLLCTVAILNHAPLYDGDVHGYLRDGITMFRGELPEDIRPFFYGWAIAFLHLQRSVWPVLISQGVLTAAVIAFAYRAVGATLGLSFLPAGHCRPRRAHAHLVACVDRLTRHLHPAADNSSVAPWCEGSAIAR